MLSTPSRKCRKIQSHVRRQLNYCGPQRVNHPATRPDRLLFEGSLSSYWISLYFYCTSLLMIGLRVHTHITCYTHYTHALLHSSHTSLPPTHITSLQTHHAHHMLHTSHITHVTLLTHITKHHTTHSSHTSPSPTHIPTSKTISRVSGSFIRAASDWREWMSVPFLKTITTPIATAGRHIRTITH